MLNHKQDSLFFGDMRQFTPSTCTFAAFLSSCQQSGKGVVTSDLSQQEDRNCNQVHAYLAQASLDPGQPLHPLQQDIGVPEPVKHAEVAHTNLWMNFRYKAQIKPSLKRRLGCSNSNLKYLATGQLGLIFLFCIQHRKSSASLRSIYSRWLAVWDCTTTFSCSSSVALLTVAGYHAAACIMIPTTICYAWCKARRQSS